KIYVKSLLALLEAMSVKGMAHITGGGITENVPRVLPQGLTAEINGNSWALPPLFQWLKAQGNIADNEMYKTFNCGIGMVVVLASFDVAKATELLTNAGETVYQIGRIRKQQVGEAPTVVV
ncbi:MAG: phosphoribosylformylglycinamidine cyclo-ligase, partial [Methylophilaceae bacterium 17-44-8]